MRGFKAFAAAERFCRGYHRVREGLRGSRTLIQLLRASENVARSPAAVTPCSSSLPRASAAAARRSAAWNRSTACFSASCKRRLNGSSSPVSRPNMKWSTPGSPCEAAPSRSSKATRSSGDELRSQPYANPGAHTTPRQSRSIQLRPVTRTRDPRGLIVSYQTKTINCRPCGNSTNSVRVSQ
jgi:hypothetical protein